MNTPDWNPALYTRFEDERTRPAAELLARVPLTSPGRVVDLGCGPGNSTELLLARYGQAGISGLDSSPAMLASARQRLPALTFELGDISQWSPSGPPVDLAYANAALQWVPNHEQLMPGLLAALAPGGVLAVQMPDNLDQPSHQLMRELAADPRFAPAIGDAGQVRARILQAEHYYDLLAATAEVDVWRSTYYHLMDDAAAIVQWLRATGLKPFVEALPGELRPLFLAEYERRIDAAYPARADGKRLLAFPRLFFVARRHDS
ncbi:trans-aconitate 2-methyltransferase [Roseateles toxinivorans]|uniref:Trans-aconitate 2-methyltransferase n=1 Tax=Roseateles toxinivorans TaxID=270368 RepID=A0A4R6QTI6_9BURK|nr:trans-aconitate 2-methyltransferase [Roseateles toxinivorans]TDP74393.1 trans-aconitate 2-methyltransferase [Roseateles toxinivorans]